MQRLAIKIVILFLTASPAYAQPPWAWYASWAEPAPGPWLGVVVEELSFWGLDALQLPYGVRVTRVMPGSPAEAGGLRAGDILLELDDQPLFSVARLRWLLGKTAAERTIELKYHRDSESMTAQIGLHEAETRPLPGMQRERVWTSPSYLGVGLQPLTEGLRKAFSVPDSVGVLVTEVFEDSLAQRAGLQAGDVIIKMDCRSVKNLDDMQRVLYSFGPGDQMEVEIIRDKKSAQLKLTLSERWGPRMFGRGPQWREPYGEQLPFFVDPDWWHGMEEFMRRWRRNWEQEWDWEPHRAL